MTIAETPRNGSVPGSAKDVRAALCDALVGLGIDAADVSDGSTLHGDFELDSTETVQVALELTRHLGVKISLSGGGDPPVAELVEKVLEQVRTAPDGTSATP